MKALAGSGYLALQTNMPVSTRSLLRKTGFASLEDVANSAPSALAKLLNVTPAEALKIIEHLKSNRSSVSAPHASALDLLEQNALSERHISTQCRDLDALLGGGLMCGAVTELCGGPGCGKTQLCIQLCINCRLPCALGGLQGQSLYLDTEGSFAASRAREMAEALQVRVAADPSLEPCAVRDMLSSIHVARAHDAQEQLAFIRQLPAYLQAHPSIRLLVIDSMAFHFRYDFTDFAHRARVLTRLAQALNSAASTFNVAVLVTNHMTTRSNDELTPALGESWSHAITSRIVLGLTPELAETAEGEQVRVRSAQLVKSPALQLREARFVVVKRGVRKVPTASSHVGAAKRVQLAAVE